MVAMGKTAWFALMNWKTRTRSPRSPVRTRLPPLPRCRAPGAVAGSHAADASVPRAQRWSGRPVGGFHRDRPENPVPDRLGGRLELTRQLLRGSPTSDQINHLSPEFRRIGSVTLRHRWHLLLKGKGVHRTGATPTHDARYLRDGSCRQSIIDFAINPSPKRPAIASSIGRCNPSLEQVGPQAG